MTVLILPGFGNSAADHWQSRWQELNANYIRVEQLSWDNPNCTDWCVSLEESVQAAGPDTVLVAHSLGCLLVAHWAAKTSLKVKAALLVAVPDPKGLNFPTQAIGFEAVPMQHLPFKSILIASTNDPYGEFRYSEECASAWGSDLVNVGDAGHINGSSGLGQWPEGHHILQQLCNQSISV